MSEFEKWWKLQCYPEDPFIKPNMQDAWIAALSWVLKEISSDPDIDVVILLEKELMVPHHNRLTNITECLGKEEKR